MYKYGKRYIPLTGAVKAITTDEDDYLKELAEELLLDELLCGECCPVEFLRSSMLLVIERQKLARSKYATQEIENNIKTLKGE